MAITKSKPSYKTINRFRVNPKVDAFIRIFIYSILQSVCKTKSYMMIKLSLLMVQKLKQMPIDIHLYGKRVFKTMNQR